MSASVPADVASSIIQIGARMHARGWLDATAGNISQRVDCGAAITTSGKHKAYLTPQDIMVVGLDGEALSPGRPSAETLLHTYLYKRFDWVGAVVHGHSVAATVLTMVGGDILLRGFEMQKALAGKTHDQPLTFPVFENNQDIHQLAGWIHQALANDAPCFLLRGHGVYAWGRTMDEAYHHYEAVEFLLSCRLAQVQMRS